MSPITHGLLSWLVANAIPDLGRRERALVSAAGVIPDLDGIGMIPELLTRGTGHPVFWGSDYHHVLAHNVLGALVATALAAVLARRRRGLVAGLAVATFHLHLLCDIVGSRGPDGYQWPIPYGMPFTDSLQITWSGQWPLDGWPNFVITIGALAATFTLAVKRGFSPLEMCSSRADRALVETLRNRFGHSR